MKEIQVSDETFEKIKDQLEEVPSMGIVPGYKIVRTYSAGVFFGQLESLNGKKGVVRMARRLWKWCGAASLSQLAVDGTSDSANCKFPCCVDRIELTEIIEILDVTEKAKKSIDGVKIWKA